MKIKAKVAFFTNEYKNVSHGEIIDLEEKLAQELIDCDYASLFIDDTKDEAPTKKASTRKKKVEVE